MNKTLILVVEDDTPVHNLITTTLKTHDYKYISAKNGAGAIMEASTHNPDIVLLDLGLPDIDGVEVIEKIRSWSNMPIIVISARSEDSDKIEALDAGADDYLTKPFSATLLHSRINNLLESRKRLTERFNTSTPHHNMDEKRALLAESLNKLDNEFIEKINQLIEARLSSEKIDIGYLADNMCMSKSTLYRKMKALTGLSTNEYVRKIKMQHAERLLLEGRYNISEVAFRVGINSVVYFRQCFKEEFGVLPSEYLKQ